MTEEPDVVIDYPVFPRLALLLFLMGAIRLTALQMSETRGERNVYLFLLGMTALGVVFCWWLSQVNLSQLRIRTT